MSNTLNQFQAKMKQDLREELNGLLLQLAILLQREAILFDYLRENITREPLAIDEKLAVELLIDLTRRKSETIRTRRLKIMSRLEA